MRGFCLALATLFLGCDPPRTGAPPADEAPRFATDKHDEGPGQEEPAFGFFDSFERWRRERRGAPHPLDVVPRRVTAGTPLPCGEYRAALVSHRGDAVRYSSVVRVHPEFRDRLRRFEDTVRDVAMEVYGRAPRRIQHAGTFACRPVRRRATRISEHAFGNAIDIAAFEFGPARRGQALPEGAPSTLRRGFTVRIDRHWAPAGRHAQDVRAARHSEFLHLLTDRLWGRTDIFRGMIGPAHPDHRGHLHLDAGPYRYFWM